MIGPLCESGHSPLEMKQFLKSSSSCIFYSLDNGYTLNLGRGLHIFKRVDNKYGLGNTEYTFRKCFECKIGVFFSA